MTANKKRVKFLLKKQTVALHRTNLPFIEREKHDLNHTFKLFLL